MPDASDDPARNAQRDRAEGRFELVVEQRPESEAEWRALRQALRLSRADRAWLEARTPGPVRRGAREDLLPLLARLHERGHSASIRRREDDVKAGEREPS